jgi:hypothetical protein
MESHTETGGDALRYLICWMKRRGGAALQYLGGCAICPLQQFVKVDHKNVPITLKILNSEKTIFAIFVSLKTLKRITLEPMAHGPSRNYDVQHFQ